MRTYLDFEEPVAELEGQIQELKRLQGEDAPVSTAEEVAALERKTSEALKAIYAKFAPWQKTQVARHPDRPHALAYINGLITEFVPLAGDRAYADDKAVIAGLGRFRGAPVVVIGQEKGSDTKSRIFHNFGMARPEGYRKAVRLMQLAERFRLPLVSFIDTTGAYPGIGAEERGQAEAIARSTAACLALSVPNIAVIIGEGGSGGAIALATANRTYMLEHAIYSVISPEGAASILWRDPNRAEDAATAMKITAADLKALKIVDEVIPEPVGGAHRNPQAVIAATGEIIARGMAELAGLDPQAIREERREKFLAIGRTLS